MKKKIKLFVSALLVLLMFTSGISANATTWDYTAYSGQTASGSQIVNSYPGTPEACTLYGSVTVVGSDGTWTSFLAGEYRYQCPAWCSFGRNGSTTNMMPKKTFKDDGYYFQESSGFFTSVTYGTTRTADY